MALDRLVAMEALVVRVFLVALVALDPLVVQVSVVALEPLVARNLSPCSLRGLPEKSIGSGAKPLRWSPWE